MNEAFSTIHIRPHILQFISENRVGIVSLIPALVLTGCDGLFPVRLFPFMMILVAWLLAYLLYKYLYIRMMEYEITEEQLRYEYGILSIQRDYIELYRVVDYSEHRSFLQLLFGLKTVSIYSGDKTRPRLDIIGVRNGIDLISTIRERVEHNKRIRHIHEITNIR